MRFFLNKLLILLIAFTMSIGQFNIWTTKAYADAGGPVVTLAIANKIDVALAVGPTSVNYANFERDLRAALAEGREYPVPQEDVYINASKTISANTTSEFTWWEYDHTMPSASPYNGVSIISDALNTYVENDASAEQTGSATGAITNTDTTSKAYTPYAGNPDIGKSVHPYRGIPRHMIESNNGATMDFYGYSQYSYKDFKVLPNNQKTIKTFEFAIAEDLAFDALDGTGFFFNVDVNGSYEAGTQTMNGYLLFLTYTTSGANLGFGSNMTLYKFSNINVKDLHHAKASGSNGQIASFKDRNNNGFVKVASSSSYVPTDFSRRIKIEAAPDSVQVWYKGSTIKNDASVLNTPISDYAVPVNPVIWTMETNGEPGQQSGTASKINLNTNLITSYGFGPMCSYVGHSCARPTHLALQNLSMTVEKVKTLPEVLRDPEWHENTIKYLVNLHEKTIQDFEKSAITAELLARLTNDDIYYIGWGSNTNAIASAAFLYKHSLKGTVIDIETLDVLKALPEFASLSLEEQEQFLNCIIGGDSTPYTYEEQIRSIADEIYKRYWNISQGNRCLVTDNVILDVTGGSKFDTADPIWPGGKWKIVHDISEQGTPIGDNSLLMTNFEGIHPKSGQYMSDLEFQFNLPGTYHIYYRDDEIAAVTSHRPPVAGFEVVIDGGGELNFIDTSYDPDVYSPGGINGSERGISKREYRWINLSDDTMTSPEAGTPSALREGDIYLITLTVEDEWGVSASISRQIANSDAVTVTYPPFADLSLAPNTIIKSVNSEQKIILTNNSYDIYDKPLTSTFTVYKDDSSEVFDGLIISDADFNNKVAEVDVSSLSKGKYKVELIVSSENGTSAPASQTFYVVVDTISPTAIASPLSGAFTLNTVARLTFSDEGGSGFKEARMAVSQDGAAPPATNSPLWKDVTSSFARDVAISVAGNNYIYYEAWDYAGNLGTGFFGPYTLNKQNIGLSLTASAQDPEGVEYNKHGHGIVLTAEFDKNTPMPTGTVFFYQGSKILGEAAIQDINGTPTAVWIGAPLSPGVDIEFRADFRGDGNYNSALGTDIYTVSPSTGASVTIDPQQNKEYDAAPYSPTGITVIGATTYIVEYEGRDGTVYAKSQQPPVNTGKYTVIVTTTDSDYAETSDTATFEITPRSLALILDAEGNTAKSTVTLSVEIENAIEQPTGKIEFYVDGVKIAVVSSADFVDNGDGTYTVAAEWNGMTAKDYDISAKYVPSAVDNYYAIDAEIDDYSINKAEQVFGFTEDSVSKTFGDAPFILTASGGQTGGAIVYEVISGGDIVNVDSQTGEVTIIGSGTAVIKATKQGDDYYNSATDTIIISVNKKTNDLQIEIMGSDEDNPNIIVFGESVIPDILKNESGGLVTYIYKGRDGTEYGPSSTPPEAVGLYTVTAISAETKDYESAQDTANFEIVPCDCVITEVIFRNGSVKIPYYKIQEYYQLNAAATMEYCGTEEHEDGIVYQYEIVEIINPLGAVIDNSKGTLLVNDLAAGETIRIKVTATHMPTGLTSIAFAEFVVTKETKEESQTGGDSDTVNKDDSYEVSADISSVYDVQDDSGKIEIGLKYLDGPDTELIGEQLEEGANKEFVFDEYGNIIFTDLFIESLPAGEHHIEISVFDTQSGDEEKLIFNINIDFGEVKVQVEKEDVSLPDIYGNEQELKNGVLGLDLAGNQNMLDYGYDIKIDLIVSELKSENDAEIIKNNEKNKTIGAIMDVALLKTAKGISEYIKELGSKIMLIIDIPQDIQGQKTYWVVRVHYPLDGGSPQYSSLPATIENNGTQLSFMTDKFSTIAILYTTGSGGGGSGSSGSSGGSGGKGTNGKTDTKDPDTNNTDPNTGIGNNGKYIELPYIKGYPDGLFRPEQGITRAEVAQIMYNLFGENVIVDSEALSKFADVEGHWAVNTLAWAVEHKYMFGYGDETVRPDANITRAELSALLCRLASEKNLLSDIVGKEIQFSDILGHWAYGDIVKLAQSGGIKGYADGTFCPESEITRAETVAMFSRILNRSREFTPGKSFADVQTDYWAYIEIMNAVNGLIKDL